ncbi:hypothetical protein HanRHA438_Chr16g0773611 [Helianthus annuus]|nr:hypothetical protein HanRHA438_Chr16g0773611 [Helianthus annuus]
MTRRLLKAFDSEFVKVDQATLFDLILGLVCGIYDLFCLLLFFLNWCCVLYFVVLGISYHINGCFDVYCIMGVWMCIILEVIFLFGYY